MSLRVKSGVTLPSFMRCFLILRVTVVLALAALPALPAYRQEYVPQLTEVLSPKLTLKLCDRRDETSFLHPVMEVPVVNDGWAAASIGSGPRNRTRCLQVRRQSVVSKVSFWMRPSLHSDNCWYFSCSGNAHYNVYDGDLCCEDLYCHELPSSNGICKLTGH